MPKSRRRGRRRGENSTRRAILDAARSAFGQRGYRATTVRAIATEAGVDAALVHHFFGTKSALYALATSPDDDAGLALLDAADADATGAALVEAFLELWDRAEPRGSTLGAMLRTAANDGDAADRLTTLLTSSVVAPALAVGNRAAPMPRLRAHLVAAQLCGLAWMRYVQHTEPIASASRTLLAKMLGPALDRVLAGSGEP